MEKVIIDTDILLDFLIKRKPFQENAESIFKAVFEKRVIGVIAATTLMNAGYVLERLTRSTTGWSSLSEIMKVVQVQSVDADMIFQAIQSDFEDKEDAVVYYAGLKAKVDKVLTRNLSDFRHSKIPVLSSI